MFLLSGDVLLNLGVAGETSSRDWYRTQNPSLCKLSVVAIGMAEIAIHVRFANSPSRRRNWLSALHAVVARQTAFAGDPLAIDAKVASHWVTLELESLETSDAQGNPQRLDSNHRMVIATAQAHGLEFVDTDKPWHSDVRALQVRVCSL